MLRLQVRRFFCDNNDCPVRTFAEQIDGVTARHARRTPLCRTALEHIGLALAGRAGSRLADRLGFVVGRSTLLRVVQALPDPEIGTVTVLGVADFAIRRGRNYATVVIDSVTHRRLDVLPDRRAATLAAWLREHPGVQIVCRDGSAAYAEAIRQAAPKAIQASDRWHLWHNLAARTRERFAAMHTLLAHDVGLDCARRLGWSLNTVKRYARGRPCIWRSGSYGWPLSWWFRLACL